MLLLQLLQRLQILARFETHGFSRRDVHFRTGPRISADARLARLDGKYAKASQFNPIVGLKRIFHLIEDCIDSLLRLRLAHSRPLYDLVHKIEFDHWDLRISFINNLLLTSGDMIGNGN
jgi:hypothetical protein